MLPRPNSDYTECCRQNVYRLWKSLICPAWAVKPFLKSWVGSWPNDFCISYHIDGIKCRI